MRRRILIAVLAGFVACQAYPQSTEREAASTLAVLERLVRVQAISAKDLNTLNSFLADDFVSVTSDGITKTRSGLLSDLQSLDSVRYAMDEVTVRVHGETAIVTGVFKMTAVQRGKRFVRQGRFIDTWFMRDGHWLMIANLSVPST